MSQLKQRIQQRLQTSSFSIANSAEYHEILSQLLAIMLYEGRDKEAVRAELGKYLVDGTFEAFYEMGVGEMLAERAQQQQQQQAQGERVINLADGVSAALTQEQMVAERIRKFGGAVLDSDAGKKTAAAKAAEGEKNAAAAKSAKKQKPTKARLIEGTQNLTCKQLADGTKVFNRKQGIAGTKADDASKISTKVLGGRGRGIPAQQQTQANVPTTRFNPMGAVAFSGGRGGGVGALPAGTQVQGVKGGGKGAAGRGRVQFHKTPMGPQLMTAAPMATAIPIQIGRGGPTFQAMPAQPMTALPQQQLHMLQQSNMVNFQQNAHLRAKLASTEALAHAQQRQLSQLEQQLNTVLQQQMLLHHKQQHQLSQRKKQAEDAKQKKQQQVQVQPQTQTQTQTQTPQQVQVAQQLTPQQVLAYQQQQQMMMVQQQQQQQIMEQIQQQQRSVQVLQAQQAGGQVDANQVAVQQQLLQQLTAQQHQFQLQLQQQQLLQGQPAQLVAVKDLQGGAQ